MVDCLELFGGRTQTNTMNFWDNINIDRQDMIANESQYGEKGEKEQDGTKS